jgi:hypothetical protein
MSVEVRSVRVVVRSNHPDADEAVAEAVARVLSRYAVAYTPGIEVTMPQGGVEVTYVARAATNLASAVRAARTPPAGVGLNVTAGPRAG